MTQRVIKRIASLLSTEPRKRKQATLVLMDLQPARSVAVPNNLPAFPLEEILDLLKASDYPELAPAREPRQSRESASAVIESGHTLRIPLPHPSATDARFLCITRLSASQWTYFYESARPGTTAS